MADAQSPVNIGQQLFATGQVGGFSQPGAQSGGGCEGYPVIAAVTNLFGKRTNYTVSTAQYDTKAGIEGVLNSINTYSQLGGITGGKNAEGKLAQAHRSFSDGVRTNAQHHDIYGHAQGTHSEGGNFSSGGGTGTGDGGGSSHTQSIGSTMQEASHATSFDHGLNTGGHAAAVSVSRGGGGGMGLGE
jgi:hypothetical protein